jgi:small subunit ribosomal protein S3
MTIVKRIIQDSIERVKVDELLAEEYEQAGYGGITLTKTPLGAQINLYAMRPGRVIGKRGSAIRKASERLEFELGLPNPQITVVEVEVPELNPHIMAARIANALERGIHYRRALFWSLRRTMEAGALGCEILLKGKLRSDRGRYEKVVEGYIPKAGEPAQRYVKSAVIHVKQKKGTFGCTVTIVPPDAKFPDKVDLSGLPVIEYPEEEVVLPEGVEPEPVEGEAVVGEEAAEPVEALEPTASLEPVEGEAEATVTEEVAEVAEPAETPEAPAETPVDASESAVEAEPEEAETVASPEEAAVDEATEAVETLKEEPAAPEAEVIPEEETPAEEVTEAETPAVEEAPEVEEVETPPVEETAPIEEAPEALEAEAPAEVEAPVEPEAPGEAETAEGAEPEKAPEPSDDSETKAEE